MSNETKDIVSSNGLLTIKSVAVAICSSENCDLHVRKGYDLCSGHYRKANGTDSTVNRAKYLKVWNKAIAKATKVFEATLSDDKNENEVVVSHYILRTSNARSKFAYFLANHAGLVVHEPGQYGKARTFGMNAPSDAFVVAFLDSLNGSKPASKGKVTFDAVRVL